MSGNFTFPLQPTFDIFGGPFFESRRSKYQNHPYQPLQVSSSNYPCSRLAFGSLAWFQDCNDAPNPPIRWGSPGENTYQICLSPMLSSARSQAAPYKCLPQKQEHSSSVRLPSFFNVLYTFNSIRFPYRLDCGRGSRQIDVAPAECLKPNSGTALQLHKIRKKVRMLNDQERHTAIDLTHAQSEEQVTNSRNIICEFVYFRYRAERKYLCGLIVC